MEEAAHDFWNREGKTLRHDLYISFPDAALGSSADIPTLEGKARIKIEPGTQGGRMLRLKGKGLPSLNSYGKGDLLVTINVWTPRSLNRQEKEILEKLQGAENFIPQPNSRDKGFFDRMREYFQ